MTKPLFRAVSEPAGRNESEREVAPRGNDLGGRALGIRAKAKRYPAELTDAPDRSHGVISDGTQARTNAETGESPPRPGKKGLGTSRSHNRQHREIGRRERVEDGPVAASRAGNAAGAKGPC